MANRPGPPICHQISRVKTREPRRNVIIKYCARIIDDVQMPLRMQCTSQRPGKRLDKKFCYLSDHDDYQQKKKEYHFRPVTTNTSSRCERSTAGVSWACPSNSRTRKLFTRPISSPEGKTPPTPEVYTFCPGF